MSGINLSQDFIIDYEGYSDSHDFLIKELSFVSLRDSKGKTYMFRPDQPLENFSEKFQRNVQYCTRNVCCIPYYYGDTSYEVLYELKFLLPLMCTRLLSKGSTKCAFLAAFFDMPVLDLAVLGCPSYKDLNTAAKSEQGGHCFFHGEPKKNFHCSQFKCKLLNDFVYALSKANN